MRFLRQNNGVVEIGDCAIKIMQDSRQLEAQSMESGGILLGRLILDTENVIIDEVTQPMVGDQRGRTFFIRGKCPTQYYIDAAWTESRGTRIYLGEWHTHPEDNLLPSSQHLRNWQYIVQNAQYEQPFLLFLIVGNQFTRIWEANKDSLTITELQLEVHTQ
jgi:integrative and conjugative element protein (TIGR02256 family)